MTNPHIATARNERKTSKPQSPRQSTGDWMLKCADQMQTFEDRLTSIEKETADNRKETTDSRMDIKSLEANMQLMSDRLEEFGTKNDKRHADQAASIATILETVTTIRGYYRDVTGFAKVVIFIKDSIKKVLAWSAFVLSTISAITFFSSYLIDAFKAKFPYLFK